MRAGKVGIRDWAKRYATLPSGDRPLVPGRRFSAVNHIISEAKRRITLSTTKANSDEVARETTDGTIEAIKAAENSALEAIGLVNDIRVRSIWRWRVMTFRSHFGSEIKRRGRAMMAKRELLIR